MLWNWYTIDSCFISSVWHVRSNADFAGTCIGAALMAMSIGFLLRVSREYDNYVQRSLRKRAEAAGSSVTPNSSSPRNGSTSSLKNAVNITSTPRVLEQDGYRSVHVSATISQQLICAVLYAITFAVAYLVMLLAMYYNGYVLISIFIGAGLGRLAFHWPTLAMEIGADGRCGRGLEPRNDACETTVCCG
jgi:solute carrier family 31 (copper transporter), member 1